MDKNVKAVLAAHEQIGCFGNYCKNNLLCAHHCLLRLRCAIEQNQNMRLELLEDLAATEGLWLD